MVYRIAGYGEDTEVHLPADLRHRDEVELVAECAQAWRVPIQMPSLLGLQAALDLRLNDIAEIAEEGGQVTEEHDWLRLAPISALTFGIRAFNRRTHQRYHRWALLLDEMELAPESVHRALRSGLRGG